MKHLLKIISYPFSILFYLCFGITLVIFHGIQWICFNVFGYQAHKVSVDVLQWFLMRCLNVVGTRFSFKISEKIPDNIPLIIAPNHQGTWDIPPIIWYLRKHHVKFISKIELGKGIPSVSYNLRHGGSVLINRKDPVQAMRQINKIGAYVQEHNRSVVIFPEGTRSRTGEPKKWKKRGLKILINQMPDGYILPISISNSWKLQRYGMFPISVGVHVKFETHKPLKISEFDPDTLIEKAEALVNSKIHNE